MTDKPRKTPGVWAKSLAKLLGGDDRCWYKTWYQAHHWTERKEESPEDQARLQEYQTKHDAIVARRAAELRAEGYVVRLEDDGGFKVAGDTAELSGKPDIVAIRQGEALVVDAKSGKRREADTWQVLIYMFALPLSWLREPGKLRGEVAYADADVPVRSVTKADVEAIAEGVRRLASKTPPELTPSKWECGYCPLAECPKRWDESQHAGSTGLF